MSEIRQSPTGFVSTAALTNLLCRLVPISSPVQSIVLCCNSHDISRIISTSKIREIYTLYSREARPEMGRKLEGSNSKELWYGVEDPKLRKRIQDRLAQRARRMPRAQKVLCLLLSRSISLTKSSGRRLATARNDGSRHAVAHIKGPTSPLQIDSESPHIAYQTRAFARAAQHFAIWSDRCAVLSYDRRLLIDPRKSAWQAFDANGQRMGINCVCIGMVCSWRHAPDLPDTLQPSPLQLTTPHPIWLDRLPFPRLRDNVILLMQMIDLEEFYVDLFMKESFHVDQNKEPHDMSAFHIQQAFRDKWGYLCY
jgi:hypothetical protein